MTQIRRPRAARLLGAAIVLVLLGRTPGAAAVVLAAGAPVAGAAAFADSETNRVAAVNLLIWSTP